MIAMIPLVLADRYMMRSRRAINDETLMRLYLAQEAYLLESELYADIIVPIHGVQLTKGYRFKEFSLVESTSEMRSIFSQAQDVSPMDASQMGGFGWAMIIRNAPVDAEGHGYYFGAGPRQDGYDLIKRFFDGLNIASPVSPWYVQLAVQPRGWIGYFERQHGSTFSFLFRDHMSRLANRHNFNWRLDPAKVSAAHKYSGTLATCHSSVKVAAHRLMLAFDRGDSGDTIVDLCIGIEAILGAGFGETVHRICMRAAAMLLRAGWTDAQSLYKAMRDTYSYRSKVVHGIPGPYKEEELRIDGEMVHAVRFATAALSSLLKLALSIDGFDPNMVDEDFIFTALNASGSQKS